MILDELVLTNFGGFVGRQVLDLTPRSGRPVIVVAALNGSGKTTILEALQLALYGPLAAAGVRRGASHDNYLTSMIHRGVDGAEGASVELVFRAHADGLERTFRVQRSWWTTTGGRLKEELRVLVDGMDDAARSAAWDEHVDQLVPRGVAGLFFFDGEQIEALADLDASRDLVETAVSGLLGLDLIDRLVGDLERLERRKRTDAVPEDHQPQLESAARWATRSRAKEIEAREQLDHATRERAVAKDVLGRVESRLASDGGAAHETRRARESALTMAEADLAISEQRLIEANSGLAPLLLVPALVSRFARQAAAEQAQVEEQRLARRLTKRDEYVLQQLRDLLRDDPNGRQIESQFADLLSKDREARSQTRVSVLLGCDAATTREGERLVKGGLGELRLELTELLDEVARARDAVETAKRDRDAIPGEDAVRDLLAQRDTARDAVTVAGLTVQEKTATLQQATLTRERAEADREKFLRRVTQATLAVEDTGRLLDTATRARGTLRRLREAATAQHAQRIQGCVLEAAHTLLQKPDLITDVMIDPATHALTLLGADGQPLRPSSLSAGERQLLAVSLLWGLARAAGRPLPVVIDTPLGRLDGPHRERLLQRYLPAASHQVVVLSTDTEVDLRALGRLELSLSHVLHLAHDPAQHATSIREGYLTNADGSMA